MRRIMLTATALAAIAFPGIASAQYYATPYGTAGYGTAYGAPGVVVAPAAPGVVVAPAAPLAVDATESNVTQLTTSLLEHSQFAHHPLEISLNFGLLLLEVFLQLFQLFVQLFRLICLLGLEHRYAQAKSTKISYKFSCFHILPNQ